eukprot:1195241-Prorocentrum_minimum.AAC.2
MALDFCYRLIPKVKANCITAADLRALFIQVRSSRIYLPYGPLGTLPPTLLTPVRRLQRVKP